MQKEKDYKTNKIQNLRDNNTFVRTMVVVCSLFAGVANGFFGGGGGMLVVPILTYLCALEQKKAHATAVAVILPLSVASLAVYLFNGHFDYFTAISVSSGVILGGIIGSILLSKISNKWLCFIFYALMLAGGIKMVIGK